MINEKLGVPQGIIEESNRIFKRIISKISSSIKEGPIKKQFDFKNNSYSLNLFSIDIEISDATFDSVDFYINFYYTNRVNDIEFIGASFNSDFDVHSNVDKFYIKKNKNDLSISINIAISDKANKESLLSLIKNKISSSVIAHEIKHLYDGSKNKTESIEKRSVYTAFQNTPFPKVISEFLHLLYYTTSIENSVRPSELYANILNNDVTKSNFIDFMRDQEVIKMMKKAKNFSMNEFKSKLEKDREVIEIVRDARNSPDYESVGSVSDDMLNILFINLSNNIIGFVEKLLKLYTIKNYPHFFISNINDENVNKQFNNIVFKYKNYSNNINKYFRELEKMLNFVGNKMMKKLYKLYDMVSENKSIHNWELHNELLSDNELVYTIDFKSFNKK